MKILLLPFLLLAPVLFFGCDLNRQVPPANLKVHYEVSAKVHCDNGKYVALVPESGIATANVIIENPNLPKQNFEHGKALNLLGMNNRPYDDYSKYKTISAEGAVSVRTDLKEDFFPIGTIDPADLVTNCNASTDAAIDATCEKYNYVPGTPEFKVCKDSFLKQFREGYLVNLALHLRPEVKVALSRSQPTCHNKWLGLDPENSREYTTYVMFTEGSRTMEFSLSDGGLYSNGDACRSVQDGWASPNN